MWNALALHNSIPEITRPRRVADYRVRHILPKPSFRFDQSKATGWRVLGAVDRDPHWSPYFAAIEVCRPSEPSSRYADNVARLRAQQPLGFVHQAQQHVGRRTYIMNKPCGFTDPNAGIDRVPALHRRHIAVHLALKQLRIIELELVPMPLADEIRFHNSCRERSGPIYLADEIDHSRANGRITVRTKCCILKGTVYKRLRTRPES